MNKHRVAVIVGTRPEAVKMAPVIRALSGSRHLIPLTISTSQHEEMVRQIFRSFGIRRFCDLRVMRKGQTLWDLSSRLAARLGRCLDAHPVDAVFVHCPGTHGAKSLRKSVPERQSGGGDEMRCTRASPWTEKNLAIFFNNSFVVSS